VENGNAGQPALTVQVCMRTGQQTVPVSTVDKTTLDGRHQAVNDGKYYL